MKHRFASHVCQTFLEVANDTISREVRFITYIAKILLTALQCRGIIPSTPESSGEGELPLMKSMVLDLCEVSGILSNSLHTAYNKCIGITAKLLLTSHGSVRVSSTARAPRAAHARLIHPRATCFDSPVKEERGTQGPPRADEVCVRGGQATADC